MLYDCSSRIKERIERWEVPGVIEVSAELALSVAGRDAYVAEVPVSCLRIESISFRERVRKESSVIAPVVWG